MVTNHKQLFRAFWVAMWTEYPTWAATTTREYACIRFDTLETAPVGLLYTRQVGEADFRWLWVIDIR